MTVEQAGERLDKLVAGALGIGRGRAHELFAAGVVLLTEPSGRRRRARKGERAEVGAIVEAAVTEGELREEALSDPSLPLEVALETRLLVVVEKAAGVPSAPIAPGERGTIANALLARYPEMAGVGFSPREPGLCHRLDTDTSGLMLAARTADAFERLVGALNDGRIDKRYLLVCELAAGVSIEEHGVVDLPLAGHPTDPRRVVACRDEREATRLRARPAKTSYRLLERRGSRALLEARATRAFRHQVRVHMAAIGAPLVGDALYGEAIAGLDRHALHASHLSFAGDDLIAPFAVSSALPPELRALV